MQHTGPRRTKPLTGQTLLKDWGLDYFKSDSILGALSDDALSFLLYKGRALELDSGEVLFDVDQRGDSFFIVLKGLINLHRPYNNVYALIHSYGFGTAVGYVSLIGLHDRTGRAQAAQPSVVLEVNSDLFGLLQVDYPQDFGILLLNLSREMARTLRQMGALLCQHEIEHPGAGTL